MGDMDTLMRQLHKAVGYVWDRAFEDTKHKFHVSYLKDDFVFHFGMRKVASAAGEKLGNLEG